MESLACSLKRRLFGTDNVYPLVRWDICALSCGGAETLEFDLDFKVDEVNVLRLDDVDQRMQYLRTKASAGGNRTLLPSVGIA